MKDPMRLSLAAACALVFSILGPVTARAQYAPLMISGMVHEERGRAIPGVPIELLQDCASTQTLSDPRGRFSLYPACPGLAEIVFRPDSARSKQKHQTILYPGQSLYLRAVLRHEQSLKDRDALWEIREFPALPAAWTAERVLTEEWIDSLPNAQHLWAFLNHTEVSVVADRYDVSGLDGIRQLLLGARGVSYTQNHADIHGIDVTSPNGDGMLAFPDLSAMTAVVYSVGAASSLNEGTGAHLSLIPKSGGSEFHGGAQVFFQSGALQNAKANERLRFLGFADSDERWRHLVDADFELGGPFGRKPWSYFGAFSLRDQEKRIRNHPLPVSGTADQETLHLNGDISTKDRLSLYWAGQQIREPEANAGPQVPREATIDQDRRYQMVTAAWNRRLSSGSLVDARFGIVSGSVQSRLQPGVYRQNREELFPGFALYGVPGTPSPEEMVAMLGNTISGAPSLLTDWDAAALQGKAGFQTILEGFRNSSHRISASVSFRRASITQEYRAVDNVNLLFFENSPESVRLYNTPARTRDRLHHLELEASDIVSLNRLNLTAGIGAGFVNGANILDSGGTANSLSWTNLSGRIGFAYTLWERHRTLFRAGIARVHSKPLIIPWAAVHPNGLGFERRLWTDANGDLQYQPGEGGNVLKVWGAPYTRLDPGLRNPYIHLFHVGLSTQLADGISISALGFRQTEGDLLSLVNEGVPFSSYTPVAVWDPGPDGHLGAGGDDAVITAYNQDPATLGKDRYVLTNPAGHTCYAEGFELKMDLAFSGFRAGLSMMKNRAVASTAPGMTASENDTGALLGVFDDPNKAILARGSTYFDRGTAGRVWATYGPILGVRFSLIVSYLDGLPYGRYLPVKGFNQGVFGILTRQRGPGDDGSRNGFRTVHYRNIDLRASREFTWGPGRMSAVVDIFNLENRGQALLQTEVTAPTHLWRMPLRFQTPRSIQLGLRYRW